MSYTNYNMITPTIAIGDHTTSYEPFDVIVNLNFPFNGVRANHVQIDEMENIETKQHKILFRVGINDSPDPNERMDKLLDRLVPMLMNLYNQNNRYKFLFHCYAGISRSSTVAICFLNAVTGLSFVDAYRFAKARRPIIHPNDKFLEILMSRER
jgi:protein-tyrosine phosphatase